MSRSAPRTPARAFTLVEVLMAVFILALGLLGIGALFPAVIRLQRAGADATFGTLTVQSAQAYISGHSFLPRGFWESWARDANSTLGVDGSTGLGVWQPVAVDTTGGWAVLGQDDPGTPGFDDRVYLPLADRLYPGDAARASEPLVVWDMAVRRLSGGSGAVQVAVFARRIDPKIRLARGASLYRAFTDVNLAPADRRWPVSEDSQGQATLDGAFGSGARYSLPFVANVRLEDPKVRDTLTITGAPGRQTAAVFAQVSQSGQIVVDNYGNVYTVQGADTRTGANRFAFRVSPSIPESVSAYPVRPTQIVMTPQAPAAVSVFTVNP